MLWPNIRHEEITFGAKYPQHIIDVLKHNDSDRPSDKDMHMFNYLLGLVSDQSKIIVIAEGVRALCTAACRWRDGVLWERAVTGYGRSLTVSDLGTSEIFQATRNIPSRIVLPRYIQTFDHREMTSHVLFGA